MSGTCGEIDNWNWTELIWSDVTTAGYFNPKAVNLFHSHRCTLCNLHAQLWVQRLSLKVPHRGKLHSPIMCVCGRTSTLLQSALGHVNKALISRCQVCGNRHNQMLRPPSTHVNGPAVLAGGWQATPSCYICSVSLLTLFKFPHFLFTFPLCVCDCSLSPAMSRSLLLGIYASLAHCVCITHESLPDVGVSCLICWCCSQGDLCVSVLFAWHSCPLPSLCSSPSLSEPDWN